MSVHLYRTAFRKITHLRLIEADGQFYMPRSDLADVIKSLDGIGIAVNRTGMEKFLGGRLDERYVKRSEIAPHISAAFIQPNAMMMRRDGWLRYIKLHHVVADGAIEEFMKSSIENRTALEMPERPSAMINTDAQQIAKLKKRLRDLEKTMIEFLTGELKVDSPDFRDRLRRIEQPKADQ